jgi:hypothetical protein
LGVGGQEMTKEKMADDVTLYTIARVKAHSFAQEYNPSSGKVEDRHFYHALKQGYVDGFLAGFEHKLTGGLHD